jgi:FKBP-type peptidyl-prolyl cis-trans isomerase
MKNKRRASPGTIAEIGIPICSALVLFCLIFSLTARSDDNQAGLRYWNEIKREAVTTSSGLQYKILINGNGRKPTSKSRVSVHYRGMLLNGVVFDSSYSNDEPVTLSLKRVIKGWQEGLQLMPVDSVFVFLIPPELAYGPKGSDPIPPNATLIFEIELFTVK